MRFTVSANNPQESWNGIPLNYQECELLMNDTPIHGVRAVSFEEVNVDSGMKHVALVIVSLPADYFPFNVRSLGVRNGEGVVLQVENLTLVTRIDSKGLGTFLFVQDDDQGLPVAEVSSHLQELDELDTLLEGGSDGPGLAEDSTGT